MLPRFGPLSPMDFIIRSGSYVLVVTPSNPFLDKLGSVLSLREFHRIHGILQGQVFLPLPRSLSMASKDTNRNVTPLPKSNLPVSALGGFMQ